MNKQEWKDVTVERKSEVIYSNLLESDITVQIDYGNNPQSFIIISEDGQQFRMATCLKVKENNFQYTVPASCVYKLVNGNTKFEKWFELQNVRMTQREFIENHLHALGEISRNFCLRSFISRLGAIILDMKKDGWEFKTEYREVPTPFGKGKDYFYIVVKYPDKEEQ